MVLEVTTKNVRVENYETAFLHKISVLNENILERPCCNSVGGTIVLSVNKPVSESQTPGGGGVSLIRGI